MRKIKKILVTVAAGVVILNTFNAASAIASAAVYSTDDGIMPYADEIETKWRYSLGRLQYRRWNATRGYWVDPEWITYVYKG